MKLCTDIRHQLLEENNEYNLSIQLPSDNFDNVDDNAMHLEAQMQVKDVVMESQRNELQRYNNLIKKYRSRIRENNSVILSMEKTRSTVIDRIV